MKSFVLVQYQWVFLNVFALVLFLVLFFGILIWTARKANTPLYDYMKSLPLENE
jgi:hypothetical protein